jgi:hypothetical protein
MKRKISIHILSDDETREPDGNRRRAAGDRLVVEADGGFKVSALNNVGGTCEVPAGTLCRRRDAQLVRLRSRNRYVGQLAGSLSGSILFRSVPRLR